jgi:hypothetical protein
MAVAAVAADNAGAMNCMQIEQWLSFWGACKTLLQGWQAKTVVDKILSRRKALVVLRGVQRTGP